MDIMKEVKALDRPTLELEYMHTLLGKMNAESELGKAQKRISTLERKVRKITSKKPNTPEGIRYAESAMIKELQRDQQAIAHTYGGE